MPNFQGRYLKQGTSGIYGNESLPNIKGRIRMTNGEYVASSGSLTTDGQNYNTYGATGAATRPTFLVLDASRSSSTYQDGAKVNPDNAEILYCIKY